MEIILNPIVWIILAIFALQAVSVVWSYRDAKDRGQSGIIVALFVLLLVWPVSLLLWLIFRSRKVDLSEEESTIKRIFYAVVLIVLVAFGVGGKLMMRGLREKQHQVASDHLEEVKEELRKYEALYSEVQKHPEQFGSKVAEIEIKVREIRAEKEELEKVLGNSPVPKQKNKAPASLRDQLTEIGYQLITCNAMLSEAQKEPEKYAIRIINLQRRIDELKAEKKRLNELIYAKN